LLTPSGGGGRGRSIEKGDSLLTFFCAAIGDSRSNLQGNIGKGNDRGNLALGFDWHLAKHGRQRLAIDDSQTFLEYVPSTSTLCAIAAWRVFVLHVCEESGLHGKDLGASGRAAVAGITFCESDSLLMGERSSGRDNVGKVSCLHNEEGT